MRALFVALAFALTATSAIADDQFDLKCTGVTTSATDGVKKPFAETMRVDLGRGVFCYDACGRVAKLAAIEPYRIIFASEDGTWPQPSADRYFFAVDRVTGKISMLETGLVGTLTTEGTCTVAPFTPMPKTLF